MPVKKFNNGKRREQKNSNNEIVGIVLILISAFFLLCIVIPVIMWDISMAIRNVVIGLFGFSAYPIFLCTLITGVALVQNLKLSIKARYIACIIGAFISVLFILHLATTHSYLSADFSTYVATVYKSLTAGGVIFGVIAYGIQSAITPVFSYIIFSLILIALVSFVVLSILKERKENTETVVVTRQQFVKSGTTPKAVMPLKDNSLFVSTIVPTKTHAEMTSGTFDELETTLPGKKSPIAYSTQGASLPIDSDEQRKKEEARKILFGDVKKYTENPYDYLPYSEDKKDNKYGSILSPTSFPPITSYTSAPTINYPTSAPSKPSEPENKRPPKIVHDDAYAALSNVPVPPPKDISDKFVGGTIINGDMISQKIKEDQMAKHTEDTTPTSIKPQAPDFTAVKPNTFDVRKYEPISLKPKPNVSIPEPAQIPLKAEPIFPVEQTPIMNGDYFARDLNTNELKTMARAPQSTSQVQNEFSDMEFLSTSKEKEEKDDKEDKFFSPTNRIVNYNDDPEARFAQLFAEEKSNKESAPIEEEKEEVIPPPSPIINADFFGVEENPLVNKDYKEEKIQPKPKKESASNELDEINEIPSLRMLDGIEDLSERNFDVDEDHTGYYVEEKESNFDDSILLDFEARVKAQQKAPEPSYQKPSFEPAPKNNIKPLKADSQLKIDDIIPSTAVVPSKPKKKSNSRYITPSIDFLIANDLTPPETYAAECEVKARLLEKTLKELKLPATVIAITRGPAVTRYELEMPPGIPIKRIEQFVTDIEYYLASTGKIRIETPIPGKRAVGIEVPNETIDIVSLRDIIASKEFNSSSSPLTLALGKDIAGSIITCNLEKMPHLLIAGATGSGKSACLNSIIVSILYKATPEDVRIMLIDPKHVEFTIYKDMPHLLTKEIITDAQQAINAFKWAKAEMERRYLMFSQYYSRNIQDFNKSEAVKSGTESKLPFIVIIVDELAELMMSNNRKELEDKIMSMAQKARAAGIHLILATQRPSVDVITGTIKANLPSRIAFAVKSLVDSRTILDQSGAETLLGRGDMLYAPLDADDPKRVQGAYITNEEVATIVSYVKENNETDFDDDINNAIAVKEEPEQSAVEEEESEFDTLMPQVLRCVIQSGTASTSMIQRRFAVGYSRASRIIDQMEIHKFIGPLEGSKPRQVFISPEQYKELFGEDI